MGPFADVFFSQGQTKVDHIGFVFDVDQDIGGFNIPVHQSLFVRVVQGFSDRGDQLGRLLIIQFFLASFFRQVDSGNVFRDHETGKVQVTSDVINGNNSRMIEVRNCSRFGQISLGILGLSDSLGMGDFDRDGSVELFVMSQVNQAKSTLAQNFFNSVSPDAFWRCVRCAWRI